MPALAVELAPGPNGVADLPSANYQQKAAAAVADGVASLREKTGCAAMIPRHLTLGVAVLLVIVLSMEST